MYKAGYGRAREHGPGITPEQPAALFRRYSRGVHSEVSDPGGTGLGRAFVQFVAGKHRGRAWLERSGVQGSTFCLSLPLVAGLDVAF